MTRLGTISPGGWQLSSGEWVGPDWSDAEAAAAFAEFRRFGNGPFHIGDLTSVVPTLGLFNRGLCGSPLGSAIAPQTLRRWPSLFEDTPFCNECLVAFARPQTEAVRA